MALVFCCFPDLSPQNASLLDFCFITVVIREIAFTTRSKKANFILLNFGAFGKRLTHKFPFNISWCSVCPKHDMRSLAKLENLARDDFFSG